MIKVGLILNPVHHSNNGWTTGLSRELINEILLRFETTLVFSQEVYDSCKDSLDVLFSMGPGKAAPKLDFHDFTGPSYVVLSDPHNIDGRDTYVLDNNVDHILVPFKLTPEHCFPRIPRNKILPFPWAIPDAWVNSSPLKCRYQKDLLIDGAKESCYTARNWCRTFPFVADYNNSGVENKKMSGEEYLHWLTQWDAAISAVAFASSRNYTVAKYFEFPAAGCLLFAQHTPDLASFGFEHEKNCIIFDKDTFGQQVVEYLKHPQDYIDIREAGRVLILERHTLSTRLQWLEDHIRNNL